MLARSPVEVGKGDDLDQLRVTCGSGQEFSGHERRSIRPGVRKLLLSRREPIDRQHDPIAVPREHPLVDAASCLGIDVEAFGDEAVHEPCGLAHASEDTMAEDRQGEVPASECAAKPASEISDDNFSDPLRALGHAGGEPRLPLDCCEGNPVTEEKGVARRARHRIRIRARHRGGNTDRAGKNGSPAIWRLNDDGVHFRRGFWRNDLEADLIRNGGSSGCKLSQAGNRLFGGDFAAHNALNVAKGEAGKGSGRQDA